MKTIFSFYAIAMMFCGVLLFSCAPEIEEPNKQSSSSHNSSSSYKNNSSSSDNPSSSSQSSSSSSLPPSSSSSSPPPLPSSSSSSETYCLDNEELACALMSILLDDYGYESCEEWVTGSDWGFSDFCPDDYLDIYNDNDW